MADIVKNAEAHVTALFSQEKRSNLHFHTIKQIQRTVKAVNQIAANSGVSHDEIEILSLASWFLDTGYIKNYQNPVENSVQSAEKFLAEKNYPADKAAKVLECIRASDLNTGPKNLLQQIVRDGMHVYIGKKSYENRLKELRREQEETLAKKYRNENWLKSNIAYVQNNDFQTEYAATKFGPRRLINISRLDNKLNKQRQIKKDALISATDKKDEPTMQQKKVKPPDRGIETMFRVTSRNHFTLSSIADGKASTLISISALIISIILSLLVSRLQEEPHLVIPTVIILITLLGTIIFAVISTRPKVTSLHISREDVEKKKGNLLFFGNFISMPVEDYEWGIQEIMKDRDYLYNNLTRDIYYLGIVLGRKYRYLRIAYNFFMYGLIISVVTYIFAFAIS